MAQVDDEKSLKRYFHGLDKIKDEQAACLYQYLQYIICTNRIHMEVLEGPNSLLNSKDEKFKEIIILEHSKTKEEIF